MDGTSRQMSKVDIACAIPADRNKYPFFLNLSLAQLSERNSFFGQLHFLDLCWCISESIQSDKIIE